MEPRACYRARVDGLDLFVRLTPKSSTDAIGGVATSDDGSVHLLARVRAAPEKGAANAALERLLARTFGLPPSTVRVVSGATSRLKTVRLSGDAASIAHAVVRTVETAAGPGNTD